jgi:hypothetical protein
MPLTLNHQLNGVTTVAYSIYTGRGAGSDGIDGALGHGPSGNQAALSIQVDADDVPLALSDLLGYFDRTAETGYLHRNVPAIHPQFPWLYCTRVTGMHGVKILGKKTFFSPWPDWDHVVLVCLFQQPKYRVLSDSILDKLYPPVNVGGTNYRQEWQRYVTKIPQSVTEALTQQPSSFFAWAEGGGANHPVVNALVPTPQVQFLPKQDVTLLWSQVPKVRGLESSAAATLDRPINLESTYVVNNNTFLGYPAGTLLYKGFRYASINEAPYPLGLAFSRQTDPSLTVDVELFFTYFNPPAGGATAGHNLAPFTDGLWWKIYDAGTHTKTLYPGFDFEKLFALPG